MMTKEKSALVDAINSYFGCDALYFDIDSYTLATRIIEAGFTKPEWISVKDRLPEEDGKYIVFEQSGGRTNTSILRFAKDARKVDRYDFKGRWKNAWYEYDSEWGHYTVDSVTHWMPLPQPPKGE
jgi:hypothetical protein